MLGWLYYRDVVNQGLNHRLGHSLLILYSLVFIRVCIEAFCLCVIFFFFFFLFRLPESQQRVGGFFLNLMPQMKALYAGYCSNHPSAVNVLTQHGYGYINNVSFYFTVFSACFQTAAHKEEEEGFRVTQGNVCFIMSCILNRKRDWLCCWVCGVCLCFVVVATYPLVVETIVACLYIGASE